MDSLDLFYRAFLDYKKLINQDKDSISVQSFAHTLNTINHENLISIYYECTIKEDWIINIEKALPFLEKAIKEDRQFIRNDQDILPIEKVRKTSRQSIQDLSKRSDYITRKPDPKNPASITPDKLMIIRKESDYAVYENRVLFTTVLYAKEFVESRLEVIKDTVTKYEAKSVVHKKIDTGSRILEVKLEFNETRKNDPLAFEKSNVASLLQRIEAIYTQLLSFLKMPLLSKFTPAELVKRPITKTNVLKINLNFKSTLALYDYLVDYDEPGYTIKRIEESLLPLPSQAVDEFTHTMLLWSFITYQHANRITDQLSKAYFEEEERRQKEQENKLLDQLKAIHLSIKDSGKTLDQYLLMFEKGYRIIEKRFELLKREMKDLITHHQKEIVVLNQKHDAAVLALINEHEHHLAEQRTLNDQAIQELHANHRQAIDLLSQKHQQKLDQLIDTHQQDLETMQATMDAKMNELKTSFLEKETAMQNQIIANQKVIADQQILQQSIQMERDIIKGELLVYKNKEGKTFDVDDFTSKERFLELERIREAYSRIFSKSWQATKKAIRKEILSQPYSVPGKEKSHGKKETKD